jgi:hypothetical protein
MRKLRLFVFLLVAALAAATVPAQANDVGSPAHAAEVIPVGDVYVNGYYRKDGTYVQPHYRSAPDGNARNNYSYPGNYNPYTGRVAPGNPDSYPLRAPRRGSSLDRYLGR